MRHIGVVLVALALAWSISGCSPTIQFPDSCASDDDCETGERCNVTLINPNCEPAPKANTGVVNFGFSAPDYDPLVLGVN